VIGLYRPGTTAVHRLGAGAKLLALLAATTALVLLRSPAAVAVGVVVVAMACAVAAIPVRVLWQQLRPLRWFVLLLVPLQLWSGGWPAAVVSVGTLLVTVAAAAVVTLTTRVTAILDVVERLARPARRFGVDPERVALVLALTVRAVPVLASTLDEVREARRARGLERSPRALLVPLVVRTMRHADRLGEALAARGVDD
jgi:biotin transport system permease protein